MKRCVGGPSPPVAGLGISAIGPRACQAIVEVFPPLISARTRQKHYQLQSPDLASTSPGVTGGTTLWSTSAAGTPSGGRPAATPRSGAQKLAKVKILGHRVNAATASLHSHHDRLKVKLEASFTATGGARSSATSTLTFT